MYRHLMLLALAAVTEIATPGRAIAQTPPQGLSTQKVADGFYLISGPGGNIALQVGKDAVFLVDDQIAPLTPALKAEIAKVTDKPVRFVLNTHWHGDHTGGNEAMGATGAVIVAHDNVRKRLSTPQFIELFKRQVPASPTGALPVITFAESVSFHLNGDDIDFAFIGPAHTDGDAMVVFHREDIIHMGDAFVTSGYPFVDLSSGGSVEGVIRATEKALALAKDTTKIIPGHGGLTNKAELKAFHDMMVKISDRVKQAMKAGKSLADIQAQKPTAEFDAKKGNGFIKPPMLVETIYKDLSKPAASPKR